MNDAEFQAAHSTVMSINLNNVLRRDVDAAEFCARRLEALIGPAQAAFLHLFHIDSANALIHMADVRFSPITFRLAGALEGLVDDLGEIEEVLAHRGRYEEDPGR
jgi:hypothetical protein